MNDKVCCFFGHRKIERSRELENKIYTTAKRLITDENVSVFLFGSKSQFDNLCHEIITSLKKQHPHIQRIYVRAEYPFISEEYKNYLLKNYEDTYYPQNARNAGRAVYVIRNREMVDKSNFCIVYFKDAYKPPKRQYSKRDLTPYQPKSGTKSAYEYAVKKGRIIFNLAD